MVEKNIKSEFHGCMVCGRLFEVTAIYSPHGNLVDYSITSSDGRRVLVDDSQHPYVACKNHSDGEIDEAISRWQRAKSMREEVD